MEDKDTILLKGRLDGKQRNRLKRLLDMLYSPSELAEEIGIEKNQIYRVYVPLGCPNERDKNNHLLIHGKAFREWYLDQYKRASLAEDETFCKTCQKPVKISQGKQMTKKDLVYVLSECPHCGRKLTKIIDCTRGRN